MLTKHLLTAIMVLSVGLLSGCSPLGPYEERLEVVEKDLKSGAYSKRATESVATVMKLSNSDEYRRLMSVQRGSALLSEQKERIADVQVAAQQLRKAEDFDDNQSGKMATAKLYASLQTAQAKLSALRREQLAMHQHLKSMVDDRAAMTDKLIRAHAEFRAAADVALARIAEAKVKHPHQEARLTQFETQLHDFERDYLSLLVFFNGDTSSALYDDYVRNFKDYTNLNVKKNFPKQLAEDYQAAVAQLDTSYVKRLIDMSESHSVMMGMVTWDNYYDHPTEHTVNFAYATVSESDLQQALKRYGQGTEVRRDVATNDRLLGRLTNGKMPSSWYRGDTHGDVFVNDHESEYVHKYMMIVNDQKTEIEEAVSANFYHQHKNSLGKDVVVKPYGMFEDEVITDGSAPGLALVGNPAYGAWNGDRWGWHPGFLFFYADFDYDRRDYRRYKQYRSSKGHYSQRGRVGKYGLPKQNKYSPVSYGHSKGSSKRGSGSSFRNRSPKSGK